MTKRGEIPHALRVFDQLDARTLQSQRLYLHGLAQQGKQFDGDAQLLGLNERAIAELRIVGDRKIRHSKTKREQPQTHVAQADFSIQLLLEFGLDRSPIVVRIERGEQHAHGDDDDEHYDSDDDCDFAHGSLPRT